LLDLVERLSVNDGCVFTGKPFVLVSGFASVKSVLQEVGEGTIGEGNLVVKFFNLGIPTFGDDTLGVEVRDQLPETLHLQIPLEDISDGLGFGLVDDELLVLGVIAHWDSAARPFALAP
jgi:hypothetical protein